MDSGPGIPADERNRIFEAFYQGKTPKAGTSRARHRSLGGDEFVNAHGGSIEILESKSGGAFSGAAALTSGGSGHA